MIAITTRSSIRVKPADCSPSLRVDISWMRPPSTAKRTRADSWCPDDEAGHSHDFHRFGETTVTALPLKAKSRSRRRSFANSGD